MAHSGGLPSPGTLPSYEDHRSASGTIVASQWAPHPEVANPPPKLPRFPVLSARSLFGRRETAFGSVLDTQYALPVNAARTALALALRHHGVGPGDSVLVPAYHCPSMVEPIQWLGARVIFYQIEEDTSANLEDLQRRCDSSVRAVLAAHYFGFPTNMLAVRAFCDERALALIEDCAHCFFGRVGERPVGSIGTYAIASAVKFFPVTDGGYLVSASRNLSEIQLKSPSAVSCAKAAVAALDKATRNGRLRVLSPVTSALNAIRNSRSPALPRDQAGAGHDTSEPDGPDDAQDSFDSTLVDLRMSLTSRLLVNWSSKDRIASLRRSNYLRLLDGLSGVPGCRPLFDRLPDGVVPYMFPLLFDDVSYAYPALAREAIPITHFAKYMTEGVSPSTCPVTAVYSRRLLQFSCHQEVTAEEIDWMIRTIGSVMRRLQHRGAGH